jgi:hypothetical protein
MSRTCRHESDPRMVVLGMSHKLISASASMSRLLIKGSAGMGLKRGSTEEKKIIIHSPVRHMIMTVCILSALTRHFFLAIPSKAGFVNLPILESLMFSTSFAKRTP